MAEMFGTIGVLARGLQNHPAIRWSRLPEQRTKPAYRQSKRRLHRLLIGLLMLKPVDSMKVHVVTPMTSPLLFNKGPPELPGAIKASE